jgi:phosphinothricin acetyltransferase
MSTGSTPPPKKSPRNVAEPNDRSVLMPGRLTRRSRMPLGTMEVRVRPGELRDLPAIIALYNEYVLRSPATFEVEPVAVADRASWFHEHTHAGPHRLVVAEGPDRAIAGWGTTSRFRERAAYATTVESSVYCRTDLVGQRVGTRIYERLFESIEGEDVERIVAGIVLPNPPSVALHRRFGFRWVGTFTRVGRKFGRYWDVAWFERPMGRPPISATIPEDRSAASAVREFRTDPADCASVPPGGARGGSSTA